MAKTKNTPYNANHFMVVKMDAHQLPSFTEVRDKEWIAYGKDNDYPYYLIDLYNRSAKHNAIVNGKVNYLLGKGWSSENSVSSLIEKANPYESLNDITRKLVHDFELFNGFALAITWNVAGTAIAAINHVDFCAVRANKNCTKFYYTKNWFKTNSSGTKIKNREPEKEDDYKIYEPLNPDIKNGTQLLYVKAYRPNLDIYPLPNYIGAVQYIDVDTEIANYHYNNLKNGFTSTYMLKFFNGIPTEEEKKKIEQLVKEKLSGSANAGKFMLNFSDGKERSAEVEVIPMSESDDQFKILNETVQQEIFSGHQVTSPMLFGIKTEGQLGGRTELLESYELFENTYAKPRKMFLEQIFNQVLGTGDALKLLRLDPVGIDYTTGNAWMVLTDEEKREKIGLPKLETEVKSSDVVDKLNTMSPLVANKILNSLSADELRSLIGLAPNPDIVMPIDSQPEDFAAKKNRLTADHLLWRLGQCGEPRSNFEVIESLPLETSDVAMVKQSEDVLFAKKSDYISKLNANDRAVIDLLSKDSMLPPEELAKATKIPLKTVESILKRLEKNGLIKSAEKKGTTTRKPIEKAIDAIEKQGARTEEIFVKYSYGWRPGFDSSDIVNSREFCRTLLKKDRLYTREEIERLNNDMGLNVWESRGGWFTEPGTDIHVPFCRHVWVQELVRKIN